MAEFGETHKPGTGVIPLHPAPLAPLVLSLAPRTDADMADVMAGLLRAAASGCVNQAARQKLQHAMRNALDAAAIMRRRSVGVAHAS